MTKTWAYYRFPLWLSTRRILRIRHMLFLLNQHPFVILLVTVCEVSSGNTPHLPHCQSRWSGWADLEIQRWEGLMEGCFINPHSPWLGTCSGISTEPKPIQSLSASRMELEEHTLPPSTRRKQNGRSQYWGHQNKSWREPRARFPMTLAASSQPQTSSSSGLFS